MSFGDFFSDALRPFRVMNDEGLVRPLQDLRSGHISGSTIANFLTAGASSMIKSSFAPWTGFIDRLMDFPLEDLQQQAIETNKTSNVAKRPVIYGERGRVGGNLDFINVSGSNNEYLWLVLDICEGEIEAIDSVYIDDVLSTDPKFSGLVTVTKYTGTTTQAADPGLVAAFPDYTTAHQLKGVAYLVAKLKFDQDAFSGFPKITCDVWGKKVYDPRTSTTAYSDTPILCLRDYFTNAIYGKGMASSLIDDTEVGLVATKQEVQVQEHDGTGATFQLLTCNMYIDTSQKIIDNLKALLVANRCALPRLNGKYVPIFEEDAASIFSFDVDNIIGGWKFAYGEASSRLNEAEVTFTNKTLDWKADTAQVVSSTLHALDNGLTFSTSIAATWVTDAYHAQDLANIAIKKSRQALVTSFIASPAAVNVVPGSIVDVTHDTPGWTAKKFRVLEVNILPFGLVGISLAEHEASTYNRDIPVEAPAPPDTNLPDPYSVVAPTSLNLFSGSAQLLVSQDGTVISRIKATWNPPAGYPYALGYDIEFKKSADTEWIPAPTALASSGTSGYISPVDDGVLYDVRVRTSGPGGRKSSWVTAINHVVVGKTDPPADVETFLVTRQPDGTRQFDWTLANPPPDLAGYKIRYKLSTGQVWVDMLPLHEGLLTSSPFETNLLAAGTYTVGIVAVDTSGNDSAAPLLISSTLGDPRIPGSVYATSVQGVDPIWDGTLTDCWIDYDSGSLIAADSKTWADFATDGVDWAGWTTWARVPAPSFTYEHKLIDLGGVVAFNPLVSVDGTGTFTVEEKHSDDNITWTAYAAMGPLVTARYIQFRVTVSSPSATGILSKMDINLSADPVNEYINDLVTSTISSSAGVLRLPITKSYVIITQVTVALQGVSAGWTWTVNDKDVTLGPKITIYNGSGFPADCTIDAVVRGI